jgi:hypothetical protein
MEMNLGKVARALETPAFVAVGFGVLGFQRAQVRRRELERQMARLATTVSHKLGEVSGEVAEDMAQDLPREASEAAKEVVALGRLVLGTARGAGGRWPSR